MKKGSEYQGTRKSYSHKRGSLLHFFGNLEGSVHVGWFIANLVLKTERPADLPTSLGLDASSRSIKIKRFEGKLGGNC